MTGNMSVTEMERDDATRVGEIILIVILKERKKMSKTKAEERIAEVLSCKKMK